MVFHFTSPPPASCCFIYSTKHLSIYTLCQALGQASGASGEYDDSEDIHHVPWKLPWLLFGPHNVISNMPFGSQPHSHRQIFLSLRFVSLNKSHLVILASLRLQLSPYYLFISVQWLHCPMFLRKEAIFRAHNYITCRLQDSMMACHKVSKLPGSWPRENPLLHTRCLLSFSHISRDTGNPGIFSNSSLPAAKRCPHWTNHLLNKWYSDKQGGCLTWLHKLVFSI